MRQLRIGLAQINTTVGDFAGNTQKILQTIEEARSLGVDLITFPELAICGYPPEDLLLKPQFIKENLQSLDKIVAGSSGLTVVVGFVNANHDIYNAVAVIHDGKLAGVYHKIYLTDYGVFAQNRYFQPGTECPIYIINGIGIGVNIGEDLWQEAGPATVQACSGAEVIVNISASPYHVGGGNFREKMLGTRASDDVVIITYTNLVGGQDELVFDGGSMIFDEKRRLIAKGKQFEEDLIVADLDVEAVFWTRLHDPRWRKEKLPPEEKRWRVDKIVVSGVPSAALKPSLPERQLQVLSQPGEVYQALVLGTRDYVRKNGFEKVVIGLSGGIDSSLTAVIAVDALGKENVIGVSMPSRYSSKGGMKDVRILAENLGIELKVISIDKTFQSYLDDILRSKDLASNILESTLSGAELGIAEENLQARIRGNVLMALSNKFGWLVLATGNKSEMACGYTTLYGDMAGGFAVLQDVPKTLVYKLAHKRNERAEGEIIPRSVLEKSPSPELRPGQKDTDTLPPYEILDPVLKGYVEEGQSLEELISSGFEEELVRRVANLVDRSEYKRRQAPPGIKLFPHTLGKDHRLPITNRYRG